MRLVDNVVGVILLLSINLLVFNNACLFKRRFLYSPSTPWHDHWLTIGLLIWAQIVLAEVILGTLGLLGYACLAATMAAMNVMLRIVNRRSGESGAGEKCLVLVPERVFDFGVELVLIAIGLSILVILTLINLITPPANWDSLNYHLTFPARRYKDERLSLVITPFADMATTYYPINAELVFLWFLLPSGSVVVSDIAQSPFVLGGFVAAYGIGKILGFDTRAALWAGILSLFIPMVMINGALWSYNDVVMGVSFVIAVYFALCFVREATKIRAILCGISLGLFIGTKGLSILFAAPLIVYIAMCICKNRKRGFATKAAAMLLPIVLFGGYTYIRNWIVAKNPVYPFNIALSGIVVWRGHVTAGQYRHIPFHEFNLSGMFYHPGYLPDWLSFFVTLPLAVKEIVSDRRGLRNSMLFLLSLIVFVSAIFYLVLTIRDTRFLIPVQILACIGFAGIVAHRRQVNRKIFLVPLLVNVAINLVIIILAAVHFMGPEVSYPKPLSTAFNTSDWPGLISIVEDQRPVLGIVKYLTLIVVVALVILIVLRFRPAINKRTIMISSVAMALILLAGIHRYNDLEYTAYSRFFDGKIWRSWYWLNQRTNGNTVTYVGTNITLPLYGHRLKNNVVYTSINDKLFLHEYTRTSIDYADIVPAWHHRDDANFQVWVRNLLVNQVDFIYVSTAFSASFIEDEWASTHPEAFTLVYDQDQVHIWKVNREALRSLMQS